jgi:hypothetical protein
MLVNLKMISSIQRHRLFIKNLDFLTLQLLLMVTIQKLIFHYSEYQFSLTPKQLILSLSYCNHLIHLFIDLNVSLHSHLHIAFIHSEL